MVSDFERICQEDFKQYRDIARRFQKVDMANAGELKIGRASCRERVWQLV